MNNATPPSFAPDTVNQTVSQNGVTWKGQPGGGWTIQSTDGGGGGGGAATVEDPIKTAQRLNDFYIQQNQPTINALQGGIDPLKQKYSDLVDTIKGLRTNAENSATLNTNNQLGIRGLNPQSSVYQRELT